MEKGKEKFDETGDVRNRKASTFKKMPQLAGPRTKSPTKAPLAPIGNFEDNAGSLPMKPAVEETPIDLWLPNPAFSTDAARSNVNSILDHLLERSKKKHGNIDLNITRVGQNIDSLRSQSDCYKAGMNYMRSIREMEGSSSPNQESRLWNSIHKLLVQTKVRMFLWRASQNILPKESKLMRRIHHYLFFLPRVLKDKFQNSLISTRLTRERITLGTSFYIMKRKYHRRSFNTNDGSSELVHESKLWNFLHNLMVQQKIKMFLWRAALNILPTRENLFKRGETNSLACIHCGFQFKNDRYVLFDCVFAQKVWDQFAFGNKWRIIFALSFKDLFHSILTQFEVEEVSIFSICTWLLWYARNKLRHDGSCSSAHQIAIQTLHFVKEYKSLHHQSVHSNIWKAPKFDYLKINTDISFSENKISIGILVRNNLGIHVLARALHHIKCFTVDYGEPIGIIEGYVIGSSFSSQLIIESDSLLAISKSIMSWECSF
ncbi:hypothetical protein M9H77_34260 [Catharanthus roseus]|uniref:Uncharacterized protein n=1 Tax=Catharanthus roseus TaxID=4058 RepID=A0ACB9ZLE7_CATRO|nr:hypothetical protein M9H77_34260 [Catharanthus roseus]